MCYEFDRLYEKARAAEHLRKKLKSPEERKEQGPAATPAKPAQPERGKQQEPVPA